jgi:hypothetical protein
MLSALKEFYNTMSNIKITVNDNTYHIQRHEQTNKTLLTRNSQVSNVNKRTLIYNSLIKPKPDDFGNAFYNYGCFSDSFEIIQNIKSFSIYEKNSVVSKLDENEKLQLKNNFLMQNGWGETKTDINESSGFEPNSDIRNKLLDPLYFSENDLENLDKNLEQFKLYLQKLTHKHQDLWFKQRIPIFQNILKIFDEFSHVELIVLYKYLKDIEIKK